MAAAIAASAATAATASAVAFDSQGLPNIARLVTG